MSSWRDIQISSGARNGRLPVACGSSWQARAGRQASVSAKKNETSERALPLATFELLHTAKQKASGSSLADLDQDQCSWSAINQASRWPARSINHCELAQAATAMLSICNQFLASYLSQSFLGNALACCARLPASWPAQQGEATIRRCKTITKSANVGGAKSSKFNGNK